MKVNAILTATVLLGSYFSASSQLVRFQEQYKIGYRDAAGNVVVSARYEAGSDMKEGFAIVIKHNMRGYINSKGEEVIDCQYDDASLFENGLACAEAKGKYGYINTKGEWVLPPIYDNACSFKSGRARICKANKWGMINTHGTAVIPLIYDRLYDVSDGLIAATVDGSSYGYLDERGGVAISFRFMHSLPFDEQTHKAIVTTRRGNYFINTKGYLLEKAIEDKEEREIRTDREK